MLVILGAIKACSRLGLLVNSVLFNRKCRKIMLNSVIDDLICKIIFGMCFVSLVQGKIQSLYTCFTLQERRIFLRALGLI